MNEEYELFVIGAGMAGTTTASKCDIQGCAWASSTRFPTGAQAHCAAVFRKRFSAVARK